MATYKEIWNTLSKVDVSEHIEKKGNLSYLSWAWAWSEVMSRYPETIYHICDNEVYDDGSVMVGMRVTIEGLHRDMWLPVMDNRNNAILHPTSRDISDARMRCLVKCLAMFGLGHYIYAGEDVPQNGQASTAQAPPKTPDHGTVPAPANGDAACTSAQLGWLLAATEQMSVPEELRTRIANALDNATVTVTQVDINNSKELSDRDIKRGMTAPYEWRKARVAKVPSRDEASKLCDELAGLFKKGAA